MLITIKWIEPLIQIITKEYNRTLSSKVVVVVIVVLVVVVVVVVVVV